MYEGKARVLISTPDWLAGFVGGGWCMVSWCRSTSFGPIYSDDKLGQVKKCMWFRLHTENNEGLSGNFYLFF